MFYFEHVAPVLTMQYTLDSMLGRDPWLMESRAGYNVISSLAPHWTIEQFLARDFIFYHSLPGEDNKKLAGIIRKYTARTGIACPSTDAAKRAPFADVTIQTAPIYMAGPRTPVGGGANA